MTPSEYSALALRSANIFNDVTKDLAHATLGITGEAGEVADLVKKYLFTGGTYDSNKMKAEVGDLLWYINLLLYIHSLTWEEVMVANIAKLKARYPEGFSDWHANNRDTNAEEKAVAGA